VYATRIERLATCGACSCAFHSARHAVLIYAAGATRALELGFTGGGVAVPGHSDGTAPLRLVGLGEASFLTAQRLKKRTWVWAYLRRMRTYRGDTHIVSLGAPLTGFVQFCLQAMRYTIWLIVVASLLLTGCVSAGSFQSAHLTNVELTEANYSIVATNVSGEATASYILGLSAGWGPQSTTFALARVGGDPLLYRAAFEDLWANFEAEHGSTEGRQLALVNVRYDADALNLIVFTQPKISIRADVVTFE